MKTCSSIWLLGVATSLLASVGAASATLSVGDPAPKLQTGKWIQGRMLGSGRLHLAHDGALVLGHLLPNGRVDLGFVEHGARHGRWLEAGKAASIAAARQGDLTRRLSSHATQPPKKATA